MNDIQLSKAELELGAIPSYDYCDLSSSEREIYNSTKNKGLLAMRLKKEEIRAKAVREFINRIHRSE